MSRRLLTIGSLVLVLLGALPAVASATFIPGPAGKIAFTSGRAGEGVSAPNTGDKAARIYVADYPSGTAEQVTTQPAGAEVRHRQPNWSPDHTRIAYAAGSGTSYAIWILDLRTGSQTEFVPAAESQDRPSWSPDGTAIAYGAKGDLWVKSLTPGAEAVQITNTVGITEERPVWSPDGNTLYYNRGVFPFTTGTKRDLYKKSPVTLGGAETPILATEEDEWQPSLSPDGNTLCFTRGPMSSEADTYLVPVIGGLVTPFATSSSGNINCVWSPDGQHIIYTLGVFGAGDLAEKNLNGESSAVPASWKAAEHFDGNADWATNFSPTCEDHKASIPVNGFVSVTLSCTDPDYGPGKEAPHPETIDDSFLEVVTPPAHGTLSGLSERKVIYTPNKDFKGTDTFTYTGSDSVSDAKPAKVTIQVGQEQGGGDKTAPKITNVKVSAKRWLAGGKLASVARLPVGTTISFRLSEAARSTVAFQRAQPGRRVGGKCAKPTAANRDRKACVRYVSAGKLPSFAGKAGANRVKFQGLLSRGKSLAAGTYRVVVSARDAAGNAAKKNGPSFTIVND
ncbi:MAG TPA: Ig-like domain-containing protein [Solirubrobacterales bacterium]|nr:Ig-like domain-containing protein [Solirubrobacterales bacterium]